MLGSLLQQLFGARRAQAPATPAPDLEKAYACMNEGRSSEAVQIFKAAMLAQSPAPALLNDMGLMQPPVVEIVE